MKTRYLIPVFLVLIFGNTVNIARTAPPSITISGAVGTNPATVYLSGQSQAVNVAWDAGATYTYCEVYYTTNGADQKELGRGHDGSKPVTFTAGSTFEFWMVIYPGNGQYSVVTRLNVVARQATTPLPPSGGGGTAADVPGGFGERARRRSDTIEDYRNAPFISDVTVQPALRNVVISFASTQSTPPLVEISKVPPSRYASGLAVFASDSGAFSRFATERKLRYILDLDAQGQQLEVGTTYHFIINVFNNDRSNTKRPREQIVGQFKTLSQNVKIVWEKIYLRDDSDDLSRGDCQFWFWANYGQPSQQHAHYMNLNMDSGENYFPDKTVTLENAPDRLVLHASGWDEDGEVLKILGSVPPPPLTGADDHSVPGTGEFDTNAAAQEFDLSKYPGDEATVNFRLETQGGSFKFIVFGRFEITRASIGVTSTAIQTLPPPTMEARGRVRTPQGSGRTTLTMCEAAREAREKNNPAAAGLEAKCRDEQAIKATRRVDRPAGSTNTPLPICESARRAKELNNPAAPGLEQKCLASIGEEIAEQDATLLQARRAEADPQYKFGFDVATAIFGDPALGAHGNTLMGSGSMRIRAGLSAVGQRGFDAAVKLHQSRTYKR